MKINRVGFLFFLLIFVCFSCDNSETDFEITNRITGSGSFNFTDYEPFKDKPIEVFYHVPEISTENSPILIVLAGAGRNAEDLRNEFVEHSNLKGFIVVVPEFLDQFFSGSDGYNLNNMFADGDNPSSATQNPKTEWTSSGIDPIFTYFKSLISNQSESFDVLGFSAGSQLVQRFLIFDSEANFNRIVLASAGWYNMPNDTVNFPYGLNLSGVETINKAAFFSKETYIIVGQNDTDPNSFNLRHTAEADLQGNTRFERAQYFYEQCRKLALAGNFQFNWQYKSIYGAGHESAPINSYTAGLLY